MDFNTLKILVVDDDQVDVMSIQRALKKNHASVPVINASNGLEALAALRQANLEGPVLVLLDINMPVMNGIEFLKELRADEMLNKLPVVVLTTSDEKSDITKAYDFNAAGYIVKPLEFRELETVVEQIVNYWSVCELPGTNTASL